MPLERRRELALLRAVGFARADIRRMVLSENTLLLGLGLLTLPVLVLAVTVTGILVSWFAVAVIAR